MQRLGTPEDWRGIVNRTRHRSEYGLKVWTDALGPVLERTAEGRVDVDFWRSLFRYASGSGPAELTGWTLTSFPYHQEDEGLVFNRYLASWQERWRRANEGGPLFRTRREVEGPYIGVIPGGQVSAPVRDVQLPEGTVHALRFVAGHFGVHQDEADGTLAPAFGWAVVHDDAEPLRRVRSW